MSFELPCPYDGCEADFCHFSAQALCAIIGKPTIVIVAESHPTILLLCLSLRYPAPRSLERFGEQFEATPCSLEFALVVNDFFCERQIKYTKWTSHAAHLKIKSSACCKDFFAACKSRIPSERAMVLDEYQMFPFLSYDRLICSIIWCSDRSPDGWKWRKVSAVTVKVSKVFRRAPRTSFVFNAIGPQSKFMQTEADTISPNWIYS